MRRFTLSFSLLFLLFSAIELDAQVRQWLMPDSIKPTGSVYNIDDDEFVVGALLLHWLDDEPGDTVGIAWEFARFMNAADWIWTPMRYTEDPAVYNPMLDTLLIRANPGERASVPVDPIRHTGGDGLGGGGQMLEVFLFDTVQSPYFRWEFLGVETSKGTVEPNGYYDNRDEDHFDWPWKVPNPRERTFTDPADAGLIAEHLAISYDPVLDTGWIGHLATDAKHERQSSFIEFLYSGKPEDRKLSVALKGHLSDDLDPGVADTDTIFIIELVHVVAEGRYYLDRQLDSIGCVDTSENADPLRADSNCTGVAWVNRAYSADAYTERIIDSFAVTKGDLITGGGGAQVYRDVSFTTDLRYLKGDDTLVGPTPEGYLKHKSNGSPVLDVKVYWTGKEEPSVRSIMLRNPTAQLMYGTSQESIDYRADALHFARYMLHGRTNGQVDVTKPLRSSLMHLSASHESSEYGYGSLRAIDRYLNDSLVYNNDVDTIPAGTINHNPLHQPHAVHVGELDMSMIEYGYWDFGYDGQYAALPSGFHVLPYPKKTYHYNNKGNLDSNTIYLVPSIAEHNGGRDDSVEGPPLIDLTLAGVEMYTESVQKGFYGYYTPEFDAWTPYQGRTMKELGRAARTAAKAGIPLLGINGGVTNIWYDTTNVSLQDYQDTIKAFDGTDSLLIDRIRLDSIDFVLRIPHQPEVSELRAEANLLLAVGGDGMQYYGMANDIDLLGDHYLLVDDGPNGPDTLSWGAQPSFGFTGPLFSGALDSSYTDVGTLTFYNHYFIVYDEGQATAIQRATDSAVYNDLWTGWRTRTEGVRKLNERVKMIGTEMRKRKLEWRDAYSVHHQSRKPGTTDTNIATVRPLPTDEIITEVTTRHPVTGVVDSTWATFVELGLFFTKTEDAAEPDPLLDTNHVYVVNRRTFERPDDISATTARGRKMDTLTESREISLTFHLENPDTTEQYNRFIRVREVLPDTSALHLLGTRHTLDTVLSYDVNERATVDLVLGPGQGTLLEVTYPKPDESTEGGQLDRNNQRKVLYEPAGDRYYMTWQKYDSVAGIDHIYLRRSLPMGDKGAVLWEATSINLSESTGALDLARTINSHPSMTYRRINDSLLIASVVWTAHPNSPFNPGDREVLLREVAYEDYYDSVADAPVMTFSPTPVKVSVGYHDGLDANEWGTPVISTARFGEYIAWSDSSVGIVARGILLDSTVTAPITWAATDTVNTVLTDIGMMPGQYPAMPPFAHREIDDSTVAIVWQQTDDPTGFAPSTYTGIFYARLQYVPPPTGPAVNLLLTTIANTVLYLSPYNGYADAREFLHPTIDQSQDALGRVMEAAGFERYYVSHTVPVTKYRHELAVQNVIYDTATSDATFAGNLLVYTENPNQNNLGYSYPVISSENQILDVADTTETPLFVITSRMQEGGPSTRGFRILESTWVPTGNPDWVRESYMPFKIDLRNYSFLGVDPNGAASTGKLEARYTAAYVRPSDSTIRTSREYFAKAAPNDYVAEGREVAVVLDDSLQIGLRARLFDVWYNDTAAHDVNPTTVVNSDSVGGLIDQLRTQLFVTGDSVTFGALAEVELYAGSQAGAPTLDCLVELVDSSTGDVVARLDSVRLDTATRLFRVDIDTTLDLLSATMYVRLRLESSEIDPSMQFDSSSVRSISRLASMIPAIAGKRGTKRVETGPSVRISAQPNPATDRVELRFSVVRASEVTLTLIDGLGREVTRPIESREYAPGRYSVEVGTDNLPSGTYIVEMQSGRERTSTRLVVR